MRLVLACRAASLALVAGVACSATPADPVEDLRLALERAVESRDAERVGELLSEELQGDEGLTRDEALLRLRRYLAAYESVDLEVHRLEVERAGTTAEVRCVVELSGRPLAVGGLAGLLPTGAVYRFELGVAAEDGVWRVRRATWEPVDPRD